MQNTKIKNIENEISVEIDVIKLLRSQKSCQTPLSTSFLNEFRPNNQPTNSPTQFY